MKRVSILQRLISILFILAGLACAGVAIVQLATSTLEQQQALEEARQLMDEKKDGTEPIQGWQKKKRRQNEVGQIIGILHIPRLDRELPIVEGVDEDDLARGVGHHSATALPGQGDQILLSGHRDTVFRRLGELEKGDLLIIEMPEGTFTYAIYRMEIVDAEDRSVIRSTAPNEILTLSTCYPFNFIGSAPERYIIYAKRF
jgi:sortase A